MDPISGADALAGKSLLDDRPRILIVVLATLFLLSAGVRLVALDAVGISPDRDFTSAIFARDFYFQRNDEIESWRREVAHATRQNQPALEPPLTDWLVSLLYSLAGTEDQRLGRLLTSAFWLGGGWFLFRIVQRLVATDAAVLALSYYLFVPDAILLSRSVQPDALMMLGFLAGLFGAVRYHESPSPSRLAFAATVAAGTILYRPLVLPAMVSAFVLPVLGRKGLSRTLVDRPTLMYVCAAVLPAALYYGHATFIARYFGWKLTSSFRFDLLAHREYWLGWFDHAVWWVGLAPLVLAALGPTLMRPGLARSLTLGLGAGYVAFGLLFTLHIHTHGYYHAQLVAIVAIAASPAAALLARHLIAAPGMVVKGLAVLALGVLLSLPAIREWRAGLHGARNESPELAHEIGRIVGHSQRVVFVSPHYGLGLQYLGELTGAFWPRSISYTLYRTPGERRLSVGERIESLGFEPEYFVITDFAQFERHHGDLAAYLEARCSLKARTEQYLIYESCEPPDSTDATGQRNGADQVMQGS